VLLQPAIQISAPTSFQLVDDALNRIEQFDWLVFSSANGVRMLLQRVLDLGRDLRALGRARIAAIGPGTAEELSQFHLRADVVPDEFRAESLATVLASSCRGQRFLLARASRGREVLAESLSSAGAIVEQVIVYDSTDVEQPDPEIASSMASGNIDWVTVTSSAIGRSLVKMFGESLRRTKLASISPITSETLRSAGFEPSAEATEYTMQGLVNAILLAPRTRHAPS
jgi:uroporphyrinogen III methyltransferase/synthase